MTTTRPANTTLFLIIPAVLCALCAVGNIILTASVSNVGSQIHALTIKTETLRKQNDSYEVELAKAQSLATASVEAQAAGFVPIHTMTALRLDSQALAKSTQ